MKKTFIVEKILTHCVCVSNSLGPRLTHFCSDVTYYHMASQKLVFLFLICCVSAPTFNRILLISMSALRARLAGLGAQYIY